MSLCQGTKSQESTEANGKILSGGKLFIANFRHKPVFSRLFPTALYCLLSILLLTK